MLYPPPSSDRPTTSTSAAQSPPAAKSASGKYTREDVRAGKVDACKLLSNADVAKVAGSPAPPKNFDNQPTVCFWVGPKHVVTLEVSTEEWLRQNLERFSEPLSYQSPCPNATDTIYGRNRGEGGIWCQVNGINFQVEVREDPDGPPNTDAEYQAIGRFMATVLERFS